MTFDARKTTNLTSHLSSDPFVILYLSWDDSNHTCDSFSLSERDRTSIWPSEIERCSCDHCCTQLRPNKIAPLVAGSPVASQCLPADSSIWPMQWCKCVCVSLPVLFDRQTQTSGQVHYQVAAATTATAESKQHQARCWFRCCPTDVSIERASEQALRAGLLTSRFRSTILLPARSYSTTEQVSRPISSSISLIVCSPASPTAKQTPY